MVQRAWTATGKKKPDGLKSALPGGGDKRRQSIFLPLKAWAELTGLAEKEGRSPAVIAQRSLAAAWPLITALDADGARAPRRAKRPAKKKQRK